MELESQQFLLEVISTMQSSIEDSLAVRMRQLVVNGADVNYKYGEEGQTAIQLLCHRWVSLQDIERSQWLPG